MYNTNKFGGISMKGIYKFTNKLNNKAYIGQSINLEKRYKEHKYNPLINHGGSKLSEEDVYEIRLRLKHGEERKSIYEDFKGSIGEAGFRKIALGYTWKNVIV